MAGHWGTVLAAAVPGVAVQLLGAVVASGTGAGRVAIRVVEVEAYAGVGEDPGSHAHRGPTVRNATMFGPPGRLYVYFTYGMHWCLNVVVAPEGVAAAVLLRAGEVVAGAELARDRARPGITDRELARGPARLARALGITGEADGSDLLDPASPVRLEGPPRQPGVQPISGPRVGVGGAGGLTPWRFWLPDEPCVSAYRPGQPRRRRTAGSGTLEARRRTTQETRP